MTEMREGYDARVVANTLLKTAAEDGRALTNMQLQKLMYIAHGWHLAFTDQPLFRQAVEAWQHGPVIPEAYREFKNGSKPISHFYKTLDPQTFLDVIPYVEDPSAKRILDEVWNSYRDFAAVALRGMTHLKNTPWDEVYQDGKGAGRVISNGKIKDHYRRLAQERNVQHPLKEPELE